MAADTFSLLDTAGSCNIVLPLNSIIDEFGLFRFVRFVGSDESGVAPAVLPLDAVNPYLYSHLQTNLGLSSRAAGGGVPLGSSSNWTTRAVADTATSQDARIPDLNAFLADPRIKLSTGKTTRVELTARSIAELLGDGQTTVLAGHEGKRRTIHVVLDDRGDPGPHQIPIRDLHQFLAKPSVALASGARVPVTLTSQNVDDLLKTGNTRIEMKGDRGTTVVYVSNMPPPD